jgi:hypothetical protein
VTLSRGKANRSSLCSVTISVCVRRRNSKIFFYTSKRRQEGNGRTILREALWSAMRLRMAFLVGTSFPEARQLR